MYWRTHSTLSRAGSLAVSHQIALRNRGHMMTRAAGWLWGQSSHGAGRNAFGQGSEAADCVEGRSGGEAAAAGDSERRRRCVVKRS
jgi:hypothetical protein